MHNLRIILIYIILHNKRNNKDFAEYLVLRNLEEISETQKELYFDNIDF